MAQRIRRSLHTFRLCSLWISPEDAQRLDALAVEQNRTQAEVRREALRFYLGNAEAIRLAAEGGTRGISIAKPAAAKQRQKK